MDHLPLPRDPTLGSLDVPLLCSEDYDGEAFLSYPQRRDWNVEYKYPVNGLQPHIIFIHNGMVIIDEHKLVDFLQTWLYFGMLEEVLGTRVNHANFKNHTPAGQVFLTSAGLYDLVKSWSERVSGDKQMQDTDNVQRWATHLEHCMKVAGSVTSALVRSWQKYAILLKTGLCIAALGEYLQAAMNDILVERRQQLPKVELTYRLSWRTKYGDCGQPLVDHMIESGWCPARIMYLNSQQTSLIGLLWYFANIRPPIADDNHANCTSDHCESLQVDMREYRTAHVQGECEGNCTLRGPPAGQLAELVTHNVLPLATIWRNDDHSDAEVRIEPCLPGSEFIAISHVWADGMGNKDSNTLPRCVLFKLQYMLNQAPRKDTSKQMPFWLDTLCLPTEPRELRRKALEQMNEPYRKAQWVIVIDSYLRDTSLENMDPLEMLARVIASGWHQRLWTFPEGRLTQNTCFLFKDKLVYLPFVLQPWASRKPSKPATPYDETLLGIAMTYTASSLMPEPRVKLASFQGVPALRGALNTRSTSRASDEALCLGVILNLPLKPIIDASDDQKMNEVWKRFEALPVGLAFSHTPRKLTTKGYRWAPASFMGQPGHGWGGPLPLFTKIEAQVGKEGLVIRLPGWTFNAFDATAGSLLTKRKLFDLCWHGDPQTGIPPYLLGPYGQWFVCPASEQWHQDPAHLDYERDVPAIILEAPFVQGDMEQFFVQEKEFEFRYGRSLDALLVTYREPEACQSPVAVRVHRHMQIQPISIKEQQQYNLLRTCATDICQLHAEEVQQLRSELVDIKSPPDWLKGTMYAYLQSMPQLMQSGRETQRFKNRGADDETVMRVFTRIVHYLILIGDWYKVEQTEEKRQWCID